MKKLKVLENGTDAELKDSLFRGIGEKNLRLLREQLAHHNDLADFRNRFEPAIEEWLQRRETFTNWEFCIFIFQYLDGRTSYNISDFGYITLRHERGVGFTMAIAFVMDYVASVQHSDNRYWRCWTAKGLSRRKATFVYRRRAAPR